MSAELAYLIIFVVQMPIVILLMCRLWTRTFISGSLVMHVAFLSHWFFSSARFLYSGLGYNNPDTEFAHNMIILQTLFSIPLIGYVVPALRRGLILPCIAQYQQNEIELRARNAQLVDLLSAQEIKYQVTVTAMRRYIRPKVRRMAHLVETIMASEKNQQVLEEARLYLRQLREISTRLQTEDGLESIRQMREEEVL